MINEKTCIKLPLAAVCDFLRDYNLSYEKSRMPNDFGWRLDLTTRAFRSIITNVYDSETVTIQGGRPEQKERIERLKHALILYQQTLNAKESEIPF